MKVKRSHQPFNALLASVEAGLERERLLVLLEVSAERSWCLLRLRHCRPMSADFVPRLDDLDVCAICKGTILLVENHWLWGQVLPARELLKLESSI
jgi:hypothetical protein